MQVIDSDDIGNLIRNKRKKLGYTQNNLSEITGLSVSFISDVERGKKTAEIGKVLTLLHILSLDMHIKERGE